jgi:Tfp pilus assembly protein PilX
MKITHLRDQRGVAMVLELVLVAVVVSLVGVAVYQANNNAAKHSANPPASQTAKAEDLAATAAATTQKESNVDLSLSAETETSADELSAVDNDIADLGGASDAAF